MKSFYKFIVVLMVLGASSQVYAGDLVLRDSLSFRKFIGKFELRKSFQSVKDKEADAFINLVFPKEGESSQNFAFALGYRMETGLSAFKPFIEWQRNNMVSKQQNVFMAGLTFRSYLWDLESSKNWVPMAIATVNYKHDNIKSTEGTQGSLYFAPVFYNKKAGVFHPVPGARNRSKVMTFEYFIYLGAEFENRSQVAVATHKGEVWRGYGRITGSFYPAPGPLDERLELVPDFIYRQAFSNGSTAEKDINRYLKLSANIVLAKKATSGIADVKIGFDYVKGSDPTTGFDEQNVNTITLKLKI